MSKPPKHAKPVIGITGPDGRNYSRWGAIWGVRLAGGKPLLLRPHNTRYDEAIDGLIISGGTDVYPPLYNEIAKTEYHYDHDRDAMEMRWLKLAEQANIPVMGICRGAQLINVARGGSLFMDVRKIFEKCKYPNGTLARIFYRKRMDTRQGSLLHQLLGCLSCHVNSLHTQAIDELGDGLTISAKEVNGSVQAIEDAARPYYLGMQFHPEFMLHKSRFRHIFKRFVEAAARS